MFTLIKPESDEAALYAAVEQIDTETLALENSPHYTKAFELIKKSLGSLSDENAQVPTDVADLYITNCKVMLEEFCRRNINFFERNFSAISAIDGNFHHAGAEVSEVEDYLKNPSKLLPEWCEPREPNIAELTEEFAEDTREALKRVTEVEAAFNAYLQSCEQGAHDPNDPVHRLEHCLNIAHKQCVATEMDIHQFNWARHLRHVIDSYRHESGYIFNPPEQLTQLMKIMGEAQKKFMEIKDFVRNSEDYSEEAEEDEIRDAATRREHGGDKNEFSDYLQEELNEDVDELRKLFRQGLELVEKLTCKITRHPQRAAYWNEDMESSWIHERDDELPSERAARAQNKTPPPGPTTGGGEILLERRF